MKKDKDKLKSCLFCGGTPEIRRFANPKNFYSVECTNCHCRTGGFITNKTKGSDKENILANVEVWNRRVNNNAIYK